MPVYLLSNDRRVKKNLRHRSIFGKYTTRMGNRGKNQRLLNLWMDHKFISELDDAVERIGYEGRSQFIRDAIKEKLKSLGIEIPEELSGSPARTTLGVTYKLQQHEAMLAADKPRKKKE